MNKYKFKLRQPVKVGKRKGIIVARFHNIQTPEMLSVLQYLIQFDKQFTSPITKGKRRTMNFVAERITAL